uniref:Uncharacterized protein n=1 Tax=Nelumbo nucifera TaxID=4432 RepID=A0A822YQL1_NELNU|nr:TPA_asm: hypothetical protein HUJ06_005512 [Nelumbo nucifera]
MEVSKFDIKPLPPYCQKSDNSFPFGVLLLQMPVASSTAPAPGSSGTDTARTGELM